MTPVRARRGRYVHVTIDCRVTLCGRRCDGWVVGDDEWKNVARKEACPQCVDCSTTN